MVVVIDSSAPGRVACFRPAWRKYMAMPIRPTSTIGFISLQATNTIGYKPYPCCRDVHSAVDAVLQLRAKAQRPVSDIQSIRVGVTAPGYQMVCVPEPVRLAPRTIVEAQFSMPYTVAAAWIDG